MKRLFFYYHITYGSFIPVFSLNHPFAMNILNIYQVAYTIEVQKKSKFKKNYCSEFCLRIN